MWKGITSKMLSFPKGPPTSGSKTNHTAYLWWGQSEDNIYNFIAAWSYNSRSIPHTYSPVHCLNWLPRVTWSFSQIICLINWLSSSSVDRVSSVYMTKGDYILLLLFIVNYPIVILVYAAQSYYVPLIEYLFSSENLYPMCHTLSAI